MIIKFAPEIRNEMRKASRERVKMEKELVLYLRLYNELKGREGARQSLDYCEAEIDRLVEMLKIMI